MTRLLITWLLLAAVLAVLPAYAEKDPHPADTAGGWVKYAKNPVLGGGLISCFDVSVLHEAGKFRAWFSWQPKRSIALVEGKDGFAWGVPAIVFVPNNLTGWEEEVNRPVVIRHDGLYRMWYSGQASGKSWIGHAISKDGRGWRRASARPVLAADEPWEKGAVTCPSVLYDDKEKLYRMWYSGGKLSEPHAIGYATSTDGLRWVKHGTNPIFRPDPKKDWEKAHVAGCQVIQHAGWHVLFYTGFRDKEFAQIGLARSRDGITGWRRHPANPILRPGKDTWDGNALYKPCAIFDGKRWLLWYNGLRNNVEQIGIALHEGEGLGF